MTYSRRKPDPFFVYGALRSGTTLLRLILNNHPGLHSPGEADYLFDHVSRDPAGPGGWRYDIEGLAGDWVFRHAGVDLPRGLDGADLAHALSDRLSEEAPDAMTSLNVHRNAVEMAALFPDARIIHLMRDPRDVARSAVGMGWNGNSYFGVRHWLGTEIDWDAAGISPDRVFAIRFEDLMADLETVLTAMCEFLGVGFEPKMLAYHETSTYAPPDPKIAQKWRTKAGAREIARIEGLTGDLMVARGYEPVGDPVIPGAVEETYLRADNALRRYRFNIRRYGFGLFAAHHAARVLRLRSLADRLAARQMDIKVQSLK